MKKSILYSGIFACLTLSLFISSCSEDDTTAPVITLNGSAEINIDLQQPYVELGALAVDDQDGDVSVDISGTVNINLKGQYLITYTATDAAGNVASAERTVNVVNAADFMEGTYGCVITTSGSGPYSYSESLTSSTTLNYKSEWSKFGDYSNANAKLNIVFSANNQITVPSQTIICGTTPVARTFSGSGTYTGTGNTGTQIVLNISETVNGTTGQYTYTYTKN